MMGSARFAELMLFGLQRSRIATSRLYCCHKSTESVSKMLLWNSTRHCCLNQIRNVGIASIAPITNKAILNQKYETPVNGNVLWQRQNLHTSCRMNIQEDKKTTALTVLKNLAELKSSPGPALALGFAGLIPFAAAPAWMISMGSFSPDIAFAQLAYGATILSFLGGVRWGLTLPENSDIQPDWYNLGYSVAPSLVAWLGLLLPSPLAVFTVMAGLGGTAYFDTTMPGYPMWFKALRFTLSFVAVLSLWTMFMCSILLKVENSDNEKQTESK